MHCNRGLSKKRVKHSQSGARSPLEHAKSGASHGQSLCYDTLGGQAFKPTGHLIWIRQKIPEILWVSVFGPKHNRMEGEGPKLLSLLSHT